MSRCVKHMLAARSIRESIGKTGSPVGYMVPQSISNYL